MSENESKDVSVEERKRIYDLCKEYLSGKWAQVEQSDLIIKPIADGFVNQLFYCFLPENIDTKPNKVVVRFVDYEEFKDFYDFTHVLTISLILSERGIAPKMLASFHYGTINECVQCRYLTAEDDKNDRLVTRLAEKLADFQSLTMPIPKDRALDFMSGVFDRWFDDDLKNSYLTGLVREEIIKKNYQLLAKHNFMEEMKWLRKLMVDIGSPIIFSHNDFNRRNILIRETEDKTDFDIFLIDFDWSSYNFRGADFGQYFSGWCQKASDWECNPFPSDQEMSVFIDAYIKRMTEIFGEKYAKQDINSRERLCKESKVFAMYSMVRDVIFCIWKCDRTPDKEFLKNGETRYRCYIHLKDKYLQDYD